jgi:hypothetical protein
MTFFYDLLITLSENVFDPVSARIVRHLLYLAASNTDGLALTARITQRIFADAIGSVREVISRALHKLQDNVLIKYAKESITIVVLKRL